MTSGSITRGTKAPVSTQSGPGFNHVGYLQKTWTGGDSPRSVKVSSKHVIRSKRIRAYVVTPGGKREWVSWRPYVPRTPNQRPVARELHENPYSCILSVTTDLKFEYSWDNGTTWYTGTGLNTGYGTTQFTDPWDTNDSIELIGRLRTQLAGSDFNLGVFGAESKQALDMITSTANRVSRAFFRAKKGDFVGAAQALASGRSPPRHKVAASNWLELQYGWLPLLADAHAAANYLAEYGLRPRERVVRARLSKSFPVYGSPESPGSYQGRGVSRGQLVAKITEVNEAALVGLQDPLSVAWELLPYSFVVDWFLPIGAYLEARALSSALTGTFVRTLSVAVDNRSVKELSSPNVILSRGFNYSYTYRKVTRTIDTTLQVPLPTVRSVSEALTFRRAANAVSLLLQRL